MLWLVSQIRIVQRIESLFSGLIYMSVGCNSVLKQKYLKIK